ncbi:hypothetical protein TL10_02415 [Mycolicibacterium llatzerense]|uniref:Uncharacterized protein n=2 Tax=Mycolicibacterium llatzerense TaxID=280871 RepID=A0A0D1J9P5_9MYCO|nr:hypothetical protein TL10_02415 [Mycolicibacterium llatzerense]
MLERMRSLTAEQIAELKVETEEPHRGYTPMVRELRNVADQLISLRAQLGRMQARDVSYMPRPQMVGDVINERQTDLVRSELDDLIEEAHANAERLGLN